MGVGAVIATYLLGALVFGRVVGLASATLAALSGPLLIYGQRIDAETLFGFLLVLTALFWVLGFRGRKFGWYVAGGVALGLASLTRPAGQILILALPLALLVEARSIRATVRHRLPRESGCLRSRFPGRW